MNYSMTEPCAECPFTMTAKQFSTRRLVEFASGEFPCHLTAQEEDGEFIAKEKSLHCAGALIFNEKRNAPSQMMRICERLGKYDRRKLNMKAPVR